VIWIPRELYAAFCGETEGPCLRHYDKAQKKGNPMTMSFSWLAILCLPGWLAYRQRWRLLLVLCAVIGVVTAATGLLGIDVPGAAWTGTGLALGFMAHGLLLTDANHRYQKLLKQNQSEQAIAAALANQAAPRPLLALFTVILVFGLALSVALLMLLLASARP
jgi:hypothetical protein